MAMTKHKPASNRLARLLTRLHPVVRLGPGGDFTRDYPHPEATQLRSDDVEMSIGPSPDELRTGMDAVAGLGLTPS